MNVPRRTFLKGVLATSGVIALGSTLLPTVLAKEARAAFEAKSVAEILTSLFDKTEITETDQIIIKAPEIAENGRVVPIEITTALPKVESITIIAEKNPVPLIAQFNFAENNEGYVKTRIKMAETSDVLAVVKADDKLYLARREVKITIGGCGG